MLPKIENLPRAKKELENFRKKSKLLPVDQQQKIENLLKQLQTEMQLINNGHDPLNNGYITPSLLKDSRDRITKIREDINFILGIK